MFFHEAVKPLAEYYEGEYFDMIHETHQDMVRILVNLKILRIDHETNLIWRV